MIIMIIIIIIIMYQEFSSPYIYQVDMSTEYYYTMWCSIIGFLLIVHFCGGVGFLWEGDNRKTVLLKSSECSPEVINFLANKACQCYVALCDWASVKEWQAAVHVLKQNSTSPVSINLRTDFNYIQALSRFEDGDLTECGAQLELLPGEDYSSLSSSKDKLGNWLWKIFKK